MRINKYLSSAGVCSRREADRLVADGKVYIDGIRICQPKEKQEPYSFFKWICVYPGMYNEKETAIPALKTMSGPYYKWSELKEYLNSLL